VIDKSQLCIHDYLVVVLMHEYYVILSYDGAISLDILDLFCDGVTPGLCL
jgi:hypothetical protein